MWSSPETQAIMSKKKEKRQWNAAFIENPKESKVKKQKKKKEFKASSVAPYTTKRRGALKNTGGIHASVIKEQKEGEKVV